MAKPPPPQHPGSFEQFMMSRPLPALPLDPLVTAGLQALGRELADWPREPWELLAQLQPPRKGRPQLVDPETGRLLDPDTGQPWIRPSARRRRP